jgi:hypothetical protein
MVSPHAAYSCVQRRYKYVIIILLLLNFVNVITMQETSGYELQNYFEHILELITKVPTLMIVNVQRELLSLI